MKAKTVFKTAHYKSIIKAFLCLKRTRNSSSLIYGFFSRIRVKLLFFGFSMTPFCLNCRRHCYTPREEMLSRWADS